MKTIFFRDFNHVIAKHPESWNKPCLLPRDADCGSYINPKKIFKIDPSLRVIEWKHENISYWTHFDEIFITKPTKILDKTYINNVVEIN